MNELVDNMHDIQLIDSLLRDVVNILPQSERSYLVMLKEKTVNTSLLSSKFDIELVSNDDQGGLILYVSAR